MRNPPTDYDGAWKEALEVYLQPFLGLAFPAVAAAIDWSQPAKFLNTELQELVVQAEVGKQRADTLVEVSLRDGQSELILIHVEVQAHRDSDLSRRMYRYHHRIQNYGREEILKLMRFLDWLLTLPPPEALVFREKLTQLEEEKAMSFVTSYERLSREEGLQLGLNQGLQQGRQDGEIQALRETVLDLLEIRFGGVPEAVRQAVAVEADTARLRSWCRRAATVPDLATFVGEVEGW